MLLPTDRGQDAQGRKQWRLHAHRWKTLYHSGSGRQQAAPRVIYCAVYTALCGEYRPAVKVSIASKHCTTQPQTQSSAPFLFPCSFAAAVAGHFAGVSACIVTKRSTPVASPAQGARRQPHSANHGTTGQGVDQPVEYHMPPACRVVSGRVLHTGMRMLLPS